MPRWVRGVDVIRHFVYSMEEKADSRKGRVAVRQQAGRPRGRSWARRNRMPAERNSQMSTRDDDPRDYSMARLHHKR